MPKRQIFGSIVILIILSFICMYIYDNYKVEVENTLVVSYSNNCESGLKTYYKDKNDNIYYLYCLDDITVDFVDHDISLDRALATKQITIDEVISSYMKNINITEYPSKGMIYNNEDMSVLKCQLNNNDYYFGPSSMNIERGFCEDKPYIDTFIRYYTVIEVYNNMNEEYTYLTISEFNSEITKNIVIEKELGNDLIAGYTYEFEFGFLNNNIDYDLDQVFDKNNLLSISNGKLLD